MPGKLPTFAGGACGAAVVYAGLCARNWSALSALLDGQSKGFVVVGAVAVLVAVVSGVLALAAAPKSFLGSVVTGLLVPLALIVGGIPRMGLPAKAPEPGEKPSPMPALWFPLSPIESVAAGSEARASAVAAASAKEYIELLKGELQAGQDTLLKQAENRVQTDCDEARVRALADQKSTLEARHQQTLNAATSKWQRERDKLTSEGDQSRRRANEAEAGAKLLEDRVVAMETDMRDLKDARTRRAELEAKVERLTREATEARTAAAAAQRASGDYARVFGWYLREGSGSARPIAMLGKKLASQEIDERRTAARLLAHCGAEARKWLERALNDSDEGVRDAAQQSLDALG